MRATSANLRGHSDARVTISLAPNIKLPIHNRQFTRRAHPRLTSIIQTVDFLTIIKVHSRRSLAKCSKSFFHFSTRRVHVKKFLRS